jgi:serine/threonine-protein kinase
VVLYEALALRRPFDPPGLVVGTEQLIKAHCETPPPPLGPLRPDAPPALVALVMRCLAKAPDERPPSAGALVSGLTQVLRRASHRPHPLAESLPYLVTLTSIGVPKELQDAFAATIPAPGGQGSGPVASLAPANVPRSELFVTAPIPAVDAPRPVDADTGPHVTQSAAELPRAVPARRIPPLVHVAFALTAAGMVGAVVLLRGVVLRRAPQADSFTMSAASAPTVAEPSVSSPPPKEPVPSAPPVVPPSASPSTPPVHHRDIPAASGPVEPPKPPTTSPSSAPVAPPRPPATPKPPDGITTQKDWF